MGQRVFKDLSFFEVYQKSKAESIKEPSRTAVLNHLISQIKAKNYLEIGVRNPDDNFNKIDCYNKFSVDPGIEFKNNPVDFKMTSDVFFKNLIEGKLTIPSSIKFDVIFIDGLHISNQVENDIQNSLKFITDKGFIVLHDCNPLTIFHQRENYKFKNSPAKGFWNGTTWKAFYKYRHEKSLYSICFDSDWGIGVLSKTNYKDFNNMEIDMENLYFEYNILDFNRQKHLNLQSFDEWIKE